MASFYNAETSEPVSVMYIATNGKGKVVFKGPALSTRPPKLVVKGCGNATLTPASKPVLGESTWMLTGLTEHSCIHVVDSNKQTLAGLPEHSCIYAVDSNKQTLPGLAVKSLRCLDSYKEITKRFNNRGMNINLDSYIDYVCYASEIVGEGVSFRPKNAKAFEDAITATRLFHHDNRSDLFGKLAASATKGEGYREVSTPSLHVAINDLVSSVHIDSYAFMLRSPNGDIVISPDVGQHIVDELFFRLPMEWLRRTDRPFIASVLQSLHPVLPNSKNGYSPIVGLRVELGKTGDYDLRSGVPLLAFESTYNFGRDAQKHEATLRLLAGGNPARSPDWTLTLKATVSCSGGACREREESVGLYFTAIEF